jgi:hypothetical protein
MFVKKRKSLELPFVQVLDRGISLANPNPDDIHWEDIAYILSRLPRFNAGNKHLLPYTVAQHSVIMADYVLFAKKSHILALHALYHDAHEYLVGDLTRPLQEALDSVIKEMNPKASPHAFSEALEALKARIDAAIFEAQGLPPLNLEERAYLRRLDLQLLGFERHEYMPSALFWGNLIETQEKLNIPPHMRKIWDAKRAQDEWQVRAIEWIKEVKFCQDSAKNVKKR